MTIDVHAHYAPKSLLQPKYKDLFSVDANNVCIDGKPVINVDPGLMNLDVQVEDMKKAGIDRRYLATPPWGFHYERPQASEWTRDFNDAMLKDIAPYGDKFRVLASLPVADVPASVKELERMMALPACVGIELATNLNGVDLGNPSLDPLWAKVAELGAFVLLHPHYYMSDKRFHQRYLPNFVGNPLETILAAFHLVTGGVLKKYPNITICLSHGGGYLPFGKSRLDHGYRAGRPELADVGAPLSEYAKQLYVDTIVHDHELLEFIVARMGASHVLLGTDYPFDMGDMNPVKSVNDTNLPENVRKAIFSENVLRILKKA